MVTVFYGETADDVWKQATEELLSYMAEMVDSRQGKTCELLHTVFSISNPREKWVTSREPPISIAFALAEIIWILAGSNESSIINFWNPSLTKYAGEGETYHGAYGYRMLKKFGIDQLERAYYTLKNNPQSRQAVILLWNPTDDLPDINGIPVDPDIPCNVCSLIKIRDFKLEWTQIIRSNDIFRGVPYNFIQFTSIQEILAGWLELEVGSYTQFSDSLHLYETDKEILSVVGRNYEQNHDNLMLQKKQSDAVLGEIFSRMKAISAGDMNEDKLRWMANLNSGNEAYDNIMLIIVAYAARKLGYKDLKCYFTNNCTNTLYRQMWVDWENHRQ